MKGGAITRHHHRRHPEASATGGYTRARCGAAPSCREPRAAGHAPDRWHVATSGFRELLKVRSPTCRAARGHGHSKLADRRELGGCDGRPRMLLAMMPLS